MITFNEYCKGVGEQSATYGYTRLDVISEICNIIEGRSQLIHEATFDVNDDVDYIWDNYLGKIVDDYTKDPSKYVKLVDSYSIRDKVIYDIKSSELPSILAKRATEMNPIDIGIGIFTSNGYIPEHNQIRLTLHTDAIRTLGKLGLSNDVVIDTYKGIDGEFTEKSIKGSIAHELTHWMDETSYYSPICWIKSHN